MKPFDEIVRTRTDVPHQDEPQFAYLNTSAREEASRVRALVECWFEHYPAAHRDSLVSRFRSSIDDEHRSAFFELFLHEFFLRNGHSVEAIEPMIPGTTRKIDFLVKALGGSTFYLEAVLATGRSQAGVAALNRLNQALRAVDTMPSPGHFLDLTVQGKPSAPVSINLLRARLKKWIDALPPNSRPDAPFVYKEHGMELRLEAWPKSKPKTGRSIGVRHFPVQQVTVNDDIKAAILKKASRYGTLELPYMIAVNSFGIFHSEENAFDALLGTPCILSYQKADGTHVDEESRNTDGVWHAKDGPRRRGVSGVFHGAEITPWNFASRRARLIRNPWATLPLPAMALGVDEFRPHGDKFVQTEGGSLGSIFGLPSGWPE
jgi:hypothetical protein